MSKSVRQCFAFRSAELVQLIRKAIGERAKHESSEYRKWRPIKCWGMWKGNRMGRDVIEEGEARSAMMKRWWGFDWKWNEQRWESRQAKSRACSWCNNKKVSDQFGSRKWRTKVGKLCKLHWKRKRDAEHMQTKHRYNEKKNNEWWNKSRQTNEAEVKWAKVEYEARERERERAGNEMVWKKDR